MTDPMMPDASQLNEADRLADLLDEALPPGRQSPGQIPESADVLVQVAAAMAVDVPPQPSLEALARMQARMMAAQQTALSPSTRSTGSRILRLSRGMMAAAASVILVLFFVSPVIAGSTPGSLFYPVKRTLEKVELRVADVVGDESSVRLSLAENRMTEALKLIERDGFHPELIEEAAEQIAAVAEHVRQSNTSPTLQIAGQAAHIAHLLDFMAVEAQQRQTADADLERVVLAMRGIQERGDLQTLSGVSDEPPPAAAGVVEAPQDMPQAPALVLDTPSILTVVGDGRVNVRSGPGMNFEILFTLRPGALVQVVSLSEDATWTHIRMPDSSEGWVASFLLGTSLPASDRPSAGQGNQFGGPGGQGSQGGGQGNQPETPGNQSDFGCDQPGNPCNAPGRQDNPNAGRNNP